MAVLLACSASFSREWSHRSAKWPSASATASVPVAICPSRRRLPMPRRSLVTAANWRDSTCSSPGSTSMRPISPPRPLFWCCIRHRVRMNRPIRFGRIPSRPQPRSCGERMAVREFRALGFDPAPGQPAELDSLGHDVARHATALAAGGRQVAGIRATGWSGQAADAFAAEIAPLPGDLDRSAGAFGTVAGALDAYARELDGAQRRAMLLEQRAAQARAAQQRAAAQAAVLRHAPDGETDAIRRAREADLRAAHLRAADADGELGAIIREAHGLHEHAFGVAEQTARQIRAAAELAPYREPNLFQQGLDVLRTISGVLKGIAAAAATLALVVQFVPVVGQVAGTISLAVAAVAGGAALGIDVLLKLSTGEGSWASLGLDFTLTVIPGAALTRAGKALLRPAARALPALARTPLVAKVLRPVEATITAARRELPGVARTIRGRLDTARRLAASEWINAKAIPDATRLDAAEQATAGRLMQHPDFAGRTFKESPNVGAEYIDDLGRCYDAVGRPQASQFWDEQTFLDSIDVHLLKSNHYTVIDLTQFTPEQVAAVRAHIDRLPAKQQARIVRIGF